LERTQNEADVAWHLTEGTEENHENSRGKVKDAGGRDTEEKEGTIVY
jgi:hypothetical protein